MKNNTNKTDAEIFEDGFQGAEANLDVEGHYKVQGPREDYHYKPGLIQPESGVSKTNRYRYRGDDEE